MTSNFYRLAIKQLGKQQISLNSHSSLLSSSIWSRSSNQLSNARSSVRHLGAQRLFSTEPPKIPKGWENFYPKDKDVPKDEYDVEKSRQEFEEKHGEQMKKVISDEEIRNKLNPFFLQDKKQGGGGGGDNKGGFNQGGGPAWVPPKWFAWASLGVTVLVSGTLLYAMNQEPGEEIAWQKFKSDILASGKVEKLVVVNKQIVRVFLKADESVGTDISTSTATPTPTPLPQAGASSPSGQPTMAQPQHRSFPAYWFTVPNLEQFEKRLEEAQNEAGIHQKDHVKLFYTVPSSIANGVMRLLPTVALIGVWYFLSRAVGGGIGRNVFQIGKSNAVIVNKQGEIKTKFADVAGLDEAKEEIMEFVSFLQQPEKYKQLGAKIPKGALLVGPPGTGKTLLAKATAGEAGVPFYSISGSDFMEMFVGVGPSRVRDLFAQARTNTPCIVFIDEIDAVGRARGRGGFSGGNDERENTLNQLLVEMDGFTPSTGIVVLAGTNRPDILDKALLRPGRFDRQITIDNPDIKGREEIFKVHMKHLKLAEDKDVYVKRLAALTPGFSGADISNVCNEAALIAARQEAHAINLKHFEAAIERVIGGLERTTKVLSPEEKKIVAYHESGHAIVGWFLEHSDPLLKVSIVPRGSAALGYAQYLPKENFIRTQAQLVDKMCMALGGRAAEKIIFGHLSTGAHDDLRKVTQMAYNQVTMYGMDQKVGHVSFPPPKDGELQIEKPYSESTAQVIDEQVRNTVDEAFRRTEDLLRSKKDQLEQLAALLMDKEIISQDDLAAILGPRPFALAKNEYSDHKPISTPPPKEERSPGSIDVPEDDVPPPAI